LSIVYNGPRGESRGDIAAIFDLWDTQTNNLIASYEWLEDALAQVEQAYREHAPDASDLAIFVLDPATGRGNYLDLELPAARAT